MSTKTGSRIRKFFVWLILFGLLAANLGGLGVQVAHAGADSIPALDTGPNPDDSQPPDAQSTTGPIPPPEAVGEESLRYMPGGGAKVIPSVPNYFWRHGCGPTAAGVVIGYWDMKYDWLISGSAATQTAEVDEAIASTLGEKNHYTDYALPMENGNGLLPDKSELPAGDEHRDNSIADFMKTSQSRYGNQYGWSWSSDISRAFVGYFNKANPGTFTVSSTQYWYQNGSFNWTVLKNEINAGRPMVFLVDSNGDSYTDHFIPVYRYDDSTGVKRYAAYTTWDSDLHWYKFGPMTYGVPWGIYSANTFRITPMPSATLVSAKTADGWILETTENSSKGGIKNASAPTFQLGDDATDRQYRAILSFNTATLPDQAIIKSVTLKIKATGSVTGIDPFIALGKLAMDIRNGGFGINPALESTDFNAPASIVKAGTFKPAADGWYTATLSAKGFASINKTGITQFRLYFINGDNDNRSADFMKFFSGNSPASKPQLVVSYFAP
jgi:hypothetical protein